MSIKRKSIDGKEWSETTITVLVRDIRVFDCEVINWRGGGFSQHGKYHFKYRYYEHNSGKPVYGELDGSYSGQSREAFRKVLKRGWAVQLVLQHFA